MQGVHVSVGVLEIEISELDVARHIGHWLHIGGIHHVHLGIQQLADTLEGGSATGGHVDQIRNRHNGPDDGVKVADELHQLTGIEAAGIHQVTAVAQNHAHDAFHEAHDHDTEQNGCPGKFDVCFFVFLVELAEVPQLLGFLNESLHHSDAGVAFLGEVGKVGEGLLAGLPLFAHVVAHQNGACQQKAHGDQTERRQRRIHGEHFVDGQAAQEGSVEAFHNAPAVALLEVIHIVGEQTHQIAHLVHLVVLPGQFLAVAKHTVAHVGLHENGAAHEAHTPQKPTDDHKENDHQQGRANFIQQKLHIEGLHNAALEHLPVDHTVDDHLVQLRDQQLQVVHGDQRCKTQKDQRQKPQIVPIDMLTEYHGISPLFLITMLNT